jgi:LysM repeat protein
MRNLVSSAKKTTLITIIGMATLQLFTINTASAQPTNASDVLKYGLSAHGISYLLRDKKGSVNAWKANEINKKSGRWGNTDCSGLVSAAIRYKGYAAPDKKGKPAVSTALVAQYAKSKKEGFFFPTTNTNQFKSEAKHGDMFNFTKSPYGHVFLYNGENSKGLVETVEAKCTKCGVGAFTKSWNDVHKSNFKLVRHKNVVHDVSNKRQHFRVSDADASNRKAGSGAKIETSSSNSSKPATTSSSSGSTTTYKVKSGDTGAKIASANGVTLAKLKAANPGVNWNRLSVGQTIKIPR